MKAAMMTTQGREQGVSLLELLVVVAIAVVGLGVAVTLMPAARHSADLNGTLDQLVFDLERASASAHARGSDVTYAVSQLVYPVDRLRVNEVPAVPEDVRLAHAITFEGGTGKARLDTGVNQAAITLSVPRSNLHVAVFVGRSGKVTPMNYVDGGWRPR
jgi:prepilin-type N-terminal cleavage/methylation domain-containing protein